MNDLGRLEPLIRAARAEVAPSVDVTAAVLARLRKPAAPKIHPLAVPSLIASAVAAAVAVMAVSSWADWQDPLARLLSSLDLVLT